MTRELASRGRPDRAGRCSARPGFTLVELLIALSMVALITLLLFSGLRLGARAWEGVDAAAERTGAVRLAHDFLSRALAQARSVSAVYDGEPRWIFSGTDTALELAAPLSEHVGVPGLYVLRLTLEGSGERRGLVLTRWLMHPEVLEGLDDIPEWRPLEEESDRSVAHLPLDGDAAAGAFGRTLLLEGASELVIDYFGTPEGETEPGWRDEWVAQRNLPALVRLRFATPERSWPALAVALPQQGY